VAGSAENRTMYEIEFKGRGNNWNVYEWQLKPLGKDALITVQTPDGWHIAEQDDERIVLERG